MAGRGRGWVTAEYGMLPASTGERKRARRHQGRPDGRTVEIQRLIGRVVRGVVDFAALGERTIYLDCDVLQADGGTRCASITGAYVALDLACARLVASGASSARPLTGSVAAISCGIVGGVPLLDLDYPEDSSAEVDANVVMTGDGGLVEVQATAERTPLSRAHLDELLALAATGIEELRGLQADGGRRAAREARPGARATRTRRASSARCWRRTSSRRCPTTSSCRPRRARRSPATRSCKARAAAAATGLPAVADDSGIEAAALGGRPGRALGALRRGARDGRREPRPAAARGARRQRRSRTCARSPTSAPDGVEHVVSGCCTGHARRRAARCGGFGYDPAFLPDDVADGRTMAELSAAEKDAISHRGRAARELLAVLSAG